MQSFFHQGLRGWFQRQIFERSSGGPRDHFFVLVYRFSLEANGEMKGEREE